MVDTDEARYTAAVLHEWKLTAEAQAHEAITGMQTLGGGFPQSVSTLTLANQVDVISESYSGEIGRQLDGMRLAARQGEASSALEWARSVTEDGAVFQTLHIETRARLLRFEASLLLDSDGDIAHAKDLASQAHTLSPSPHDTRLHAVFVYRERGPAPALETLQGSDDIDTMNLRASLLLAAGRLEECAATLEAAAALSSDNADTHRLSALYLLTENELDQADLAIHKALDLEPNWADAKYAAAVIAYYSAISPGARLASLSPWPEPVDWKLVRNDQQSVQRLRKAADVFLDLSKRANKKERQRLKVWVLACMANDPEREEETRQFCVSSLQVDAADPHTIAWAVSRSMNIDLTPIVQALAQLMADGLAEIPHVLALVGCYATLGEFEKAEGVLASGKGLFDNPDTEVLWTHWRAQLLTASGKPSEALILIETAAGARQLLDAQAVALQSIALNTGEWDTLVQHLQMAYRETKNPLFLQGACGVKAQLGDWGYVADQAERLTMEIGTSEAIRLAAIGLFNSGLHERCLWLLDRNSGLFRAGRLPDVLRRMRTLCLQRLGMLPQAVSEAEAHAREEPTEENLLTLAQLYFSVGDLKRLASIGQQISLLPQLTPVAALSMAQIVQLEDIDLARKLWRKASGHGLPDELVGQALVLGFRLGLDDELESLHFRFERLGHERRMGIEAVTVHDFIELIKGQKARSAEMWDKYRRGTIPIHFLVEQLNIPLVNHYSGIPQSNEASPDPLNQIPLYARHGGRPVAARIPEEPSNCRLILDVTAMLLAAYLDVLSAVEARFLTLYVPGQLVPALVGMQEALIPHQPSRLRNLQEIVGLVEQGKLKVASRPSTPASESEFAKALGYDRAALIETARTNQGYFLDFLPLRPEDDQDLSHEMLNRITPYLVSSRSVLDALRLGGPLSQAEYSAALAKLGDSIQAQIDTASPKQGSPLYCHGNTIEVLAGTGLLPLICDRFSVHIDQGEASQARAELASQLVLESEREWLERLVQQLRAGLSEGTYRIIPIPPDGKSKDNSDVTEGQPVLDCLRTLLRFKPAEGDVIWCDDRYVNGYANRDGTPIVSIVEVLQALLKAGALDKDVYFQKLRLLRESNVRFVPVDKDEILHHIRGATIRDGMLVETRELSAVRRYLAACVTDASLQRPPMPAGATNPQGEADFVMGAARAVADALVELWAASEEDDLTREIRAEWILNCIFLDHLGFFMAASMLREDRHGAYQTGIGLASLLMRGISLPRRKGGQGETPRRSYMNWLDARLLKARVAASPGLLPLVCDILKQYMLAAPQEIQSPIPTSAVQIFLAGFLEDLPVIVREELVRDGDFVERLGIRFQTIAAVGGLKLRPEDFLRAAKDALEGRLGIAVTIDSQVQVVFRRIEEDAGSGSFLVTDSTTNETFNVKDDLLMLLSESAVEREKVLRANRHWFECAQQMFEREVGRIASIEDPSERLQAARSWRDTSTEAGYTRLATQLQNNQRFSIDDLLSPNPGGLLWRLRLESPVDAIRTFQQDLDLAAQKLIDEVGLMESINRMSGLPVPLPRSIIARVGDLPAAERRDLFRSVAGAPGTPLTKLHALHLLSSFPDTPGAQELVQLLLQDLLGDRGEAHFKLFLAILVWVESKLSSFRDVLQMPPEARLAIVWTHAHRLFQLFEQAGAPVDWLTKFFHQAPRQVPPDILTARGEYWFDITHPRRIARISFLISGLSYALVDQLRGAVDNEHQAAVQDLLMTSVHDTRFPALELLRDPSLCTNGLGSFLGDNRCQDFAFVLQEKKDRQQLLLSPRKRAESALVQLSSGQDWASGWLTLYAVIGDLPLYDTMRQRFRSLVVQTRFSDLIVQSPQSGLIALLMACEQAAQLADIEGISHLSNELSKTAGVLTEWEASSRDKAARANAEADESPRLWPLVLESAAYLAIAYEQVGKGKASTEFASLVLKLTDAWPSVSPDVRLLIQHFCEELPIEDALELYPLFERLRAM